MAKKLRLMLEVGPKGKRVVAVAPDWPGLERGAKTEEAAIETLVSYLPRYARVAKLAGMDAEYGSLKGTSIVERYEGVGSTDFWGISFALSSLDTQPLSTDELDRQLTIMKSCWKFFDEVRRKVSAEMQRGPRGGGRDRDRIVRHVLATEQDWQKKLGLRPAEEIVTDDKAVRSFRSSYCKAIETFHSEDKMARTWPLRYLIRHTGYHTMDHAWEMQDKDLTGTA
jgi:hypothetical protein